jgi:SAM-dependent methyltransferase
MLLDFGPQPPSNRFERTDVPNRETHALVLGQCAGCGLLQLVNPMAPAMVKSRFEWLTYNEPEGHLDDLVGRLRNLPGIGRESHIVGVTYKDDTTLARFNRLGYANTRRFAAAADLDLTDPRAGLESIQSALDQARARRLAALHGRADLLVVRHVLEHAHRPAEFLRALLELVKSGGYLVFEMPDSTTFVKACDYSFVWEEHIAYFSRDTLEAFFGSAGAAVHAVHLYPYPLEDSLIAVVRNASSANSARSSQAELEATLGSGRVFARRYPELKAGVREVIRRWRGEGKKVAVFGAGHLAAKFINLFSVADLIECVIDDNPHKQALLMPGSRLPIRGSAELASGPIDVCLLSLNPESEQKVRAKNQAFLERGGRFASIFAVSPQAVQRLTPA